MSGPRRAGTLVARVRAPCPALRRTGAVLAGTAGSAVVGAVSGPRRAAARVAEPDLLSSVDPTGKKSRSLGAALSGLWGARGPSPPPPSAGLYFPSPQAQATRSLERRSDARAAEVGIFHQPGRVKFENRL